MFANWLSKTVAWWFAILLLMLLSACGTSAPERQAAFETKQGKATLSPINQTQYLFLGEEEQASVAYQVEGTNKLTKAVDILILFDRTGSMEREIKETAKAARHIVNDIQDAAPNTRFAVATVSDYSPMFTPAKDTRTWLLQADFTQSAVAIEQASKSISLVNGGDNPEAYSRGFYEASEMHWRAEAKKIIVFFGDSIDHPKDPGRDQIMGTADDLTIDRVLSKLHSQRINIVGVYTSDKSEVKSFFRKISQQTDGEVVSLADASESGELIIDSIKMALRQKVRLTASGSYQDWVTVEQNNHGLYGTDFNIQMKPPISTPAGVYEISFDFTLDASEDQLSGVTQRRDVTIKLVTGWYNHPLLLWLPLLFFLLFLLWSAFKMLSGGYRVKRSIVRRGRYDMDTYSWRHLLMDIAFLITLSSTLLALYLGFQDLVLSQVL